MNLIKARQLANSILGHEPFKWINRYYKYDHPNHAILNEAIIMTPDFGTIWSGSIDLTKFYKKITKLSKEINLSLIISQKSLFGGNNLEYEYDVIISNTEYGIFWMINMEKHSDWYISNDKIHREFTKNLMSEIGGLKSPIHIWNDMVTRKDFVKTKLPNLKKFRGGRSGRITPWEQLKNFFIKKYGNKMGEKIWNNLYLTVDDAKIIQNNCLRFHKKHNSHMHPLLIEDSVIWDYARNGCFIFYQLKLDWIKGGYGYIKND